MHVLFILGLVLLYIVGTVYLLWVVHLTLGRICVRHAKRFCRRNGLGVCRARWQPAFEPSGGKRVKTEFTLVQMDCLDAQKQRRLVLLLVWPFGVRKMVSDEKYPDSYDEQWPQKPQNTTLKPTPTVP